jgi:RNA polymerase sigma-70 factor (ECF subfamily)
MDLAQDKELVELARNDPQAFGVLFDEYYGRIFGYALRRTASVENAQDVTSETFFKALRNIKKFEWRGVTFSAWLYRIAEHEISNIYSGNGHDRVLTDELRRSLELEGASLEAEVAQAETLIQKESVLHSLNELLAKLPAKYREVLALRFFEQKQFSEIAKILGKSEGTVKSLLYRGLEKLRKLTEQNATI